MKRTLPSSVTYSDIPMPQPLGWSSEYRDSELDLIYYNYRHYNPQDGRWINRAPIGIQGGYNLYGFMENKVSYSTDYIGYFGIFGMIIGAVTDYAIQVATNYEEGKKNPWTDVSSGSIIASGAFGALGIPGGAALAGKAYKAGKAALKTPSPSTTKNFSKGNYQKKFYIMN